MGRAGNSGGGECVVGVAEFPYPFCHGDGYLTANTAEIVVRFVGNSQHALLQTTGVGNHAAGTVCGAAGHGSQHIANQSHGIGFGYGHGFALGNQ